MVESGAGVEPVRCGVLEPLQETGDDATCAEGGMPFAVGVEIDAEDAADENVGVSDESIVSDECGRWSVGVVAVEPQLNVLVVSCDRQPGSDSLDIPGVDAHLSVELPFADMEVRHAEERGVAVGELEEFGSRLSLSGRALLGSCGLGVRSTLLATLLRLAGHARFLSRRDST